MTNTEISLSFGSIVIGVFCYFAGAQQERRKFKNDKIDSIVQKYFTIKNQGIYLESDYPDILIKAGILILTEPVDIQNVIRRITLHGEKDPFSSFPLNGIKEKICFLNACAERLNKNS